MSESAVNLSATLHGTQPAAPVPGGSRHLDVFWVDDPLRGTRLHVSATAQSWGVQPDTLCGAREHWLVYVHPDDHAALRTAWMGLAHGQGFALEYRWIGADQLERRVRERGDLMPPTHGVPSHAVGLLEDVTQHQQALAALAESTFQLQWLTESVPFPLAQIDIGHCVRFADRKSVV